MEQNGFSQMKIIAFSKYLIYSVGGAEKDAFEVLQKHEQDGDSIELVSFPPARNYNTSSKKVGINPNWKLTIIKNVSLFKRFHYYEYLLNKRSLKLFFSDYNSSNELHTYGLYAPVAANSFRGKCKIFIKSESDLAINKNYNIGFKRHLKTISKILEFPAYLIYKRDLIKALKKAEIISNSNYTANRLKGLYGIKSSVQYPPIETERLLIEIKEVESEIQNKGIVFIGDSTNKGLHIATSIAKLVPSQHFYFFGRYVDKPNTVGNITFMPWQKREVDIYKYAKLVIVPSIWEEAYGRVSREAFILGIPVLVSNIGGLPETVDNRQQNIVDEFHEPPHWVQAINNILEVQTTKKHYSKK